MYKTRWFYSDKCAGDGTYFGLVGQWDLLNLTTMLKNWCFRTVVLKKTLESPLDNKEIQSFNPKRNQSWIFIGRTNSEAEAPMLWAPNAKNWSFHTVVLDNILESPLDSKKIKSVDSKGDQPWVFFVRNDAKAETSVLWPPHAKSWLIGKDSDAGRDLGARGEGDDRGWDGWMASLTRWTWVSVNSGSWWWTGRPGVLQFMGSQRVGHYWATDLIWCKWIVIELN